MKAISPMIAVVLLLAFTVAVGGILSVWFTSFTRTTTGGVESATVNQTRCAGCYISVDSVSTSSIIYSNPCTQSITMTDGITGDGTLLTVSGTLNPGDLSSISWTRGTNTSVILKAKCLATVPVEGSCEQGDTCWKL